MNKYIVVFALALGACGGMGSLEPGTAEIEGQVAGRSIAPRTAFLTVHPQVFIEMIIMSEDIDFDCDAMAQVDTGLVVGIAFPCEIAGVTTYALGTGDSLDCMLDTKVAFMAVEGFTDTSGYSARAGSMTIVERDSEVIIGSFTADFGVQGALTGEFSARICP